MTRDNSIDVFRTGYHSCFSAAHHIFKKSAEQSPVCKVQELTLKEKNVIRYIAGYVFLKLRNKFSKIQRRTVGSMEQWFYSILTCISFPDTMPVFYITFGIP